MIQYALPLAYIT